MSLALWAAIGVNWMNAQSSDKGFKAFYDISVNRIQPVKDLQNQFTENRLWMAIAHRNFLQQKPDEVKSAIEIADKALQRVDEINQTNSGNGASAWPEVEKLAADYAKILAEYRKVTHSAAAALVNNDGNVYIETVNERNRLVAEADKISDAYFKIMDASSRSYVDIAATQYERALIMSIVLFVLSLILIYGGWRYVQTQILRPLSQAGEELSLVASGDLTHQVAVDSNNEIGQLFLAIQKMQVSLSSVVTKVRQGVEEIHTGAQEIAQGNSNLSNRTEDQAASLEETASSMEELASTVRQNADNVRQADQLSDNSMNIAHRGGNVVSEVVTTMQAISASSHKITDIVNVIDGIAFQTNILALNAAVEAARAGEQGRGFAVVASEVRTLAQRSAQAAREIKTLIEDSVSRVEAGSQQVELAGNTMTEIVDSVKRVTDIMGAVSSAIQEQSSGIEQINLAVVQMDEVTQQNAALVEQSAAAAKSLEQQAFQLNQAVAVFKVNSSTALASPELVNIQRQEPLAIQRSAPALLH